MRTFTVSVWPLTLWGMAIVTSLMAGSHNGAWFLALILWAAGLVLIVRRWFQAAGAVQVGPTT